MKRCLTFIAACLLSFSSAVFADAQLNFNVKQNDTPQEMSIYIKGGQALITQSGNSSSQVLFDASAQSFTLLEHGQKSYTVINQATINQMTQLVKSMGEIAKTQGGVLGDVLKSVGLDNGLGTTEAVTIASTGQQINIAGLSCNIHQVKKGETVQTKLCVRDSLPIGEQESATLKSLVAFGQSISTQAGSLIAQLGVVIPTLPKQDLGGFVIGADVTEPKTQARLASIEQTALAPDDFSVPADYTETSLPF